MPGEAARVPSIDQLVELHQALWWFMDLDHARITPTFEQENQCLPRFERLADALDQIRPGIETVRSWPTKIGRALRSIVSAFDETTRLWGWDWIVKPKSERSTYLKERCASLDNALDEPIPEAALFLADRWDEGKHCPYDDLADEARRRGLIPRSMTPKEAHDQYKEARARFNWEPRFGKCYPKIGETEYKALAEAWHTLRSELLRLAPDRVERPPWQARPEPASPSAPQADGHEDSAEVKPLPDSPTSSTQGPSMPARPLPSDRELLLRMLDEITEFLRNATKLQETMRTTRRLRNVPETTSLFSRNMLSSPPLGAKQGGGQHGRLCTGNRTEDEAAL